MKPHFFALALAAAIAAPAALAAQQQTQDTTTQHPAKHHAHKKTTSNDSASGRTVPNQSQSGMTNKQGHSTLGPKVKKTTPTQGHAVTAKGDTLSPDSSRKPPTMHDSTTGKP
jgi:Ni/Co efflux regulator RcnB